MAKRLTFLEREDTAVDKLLRGDLTPSRRHPGRAPVDYLSTYDDGSACIYCGEQDCDRVDAHGLGTASINSDQVGAFPFHRFEGPGHRLAPPAARKGYEQRWCRADHAIPGGWHIRYFGRREPIFGLFGRAGVPLYIDNRYDNRSGDICAIVLCERLLPVPCLRPPWDRIRSGVWLWWRKHVVWRWYKHTAWLRVRTTEHVHDMDYDERKDFYETLARHQRALRVAVAILAASHLIHVPAWLHWLNEVLQ